MQVLRIQYCTGLSGFCSNQVTCIENIFGFSKLLFFGRSQENLLKIVGARLSFSPNRLRAEKDQNAELESKSRTKLSSGPLVLCLHVV